LPRSAGCHQRAACRAGVIAQTVARGAGLVRRPDRFLEYFTDGAVYHDMLSTRTQKSEFLQANGAVVDVCGGMPCLAP